MRLERLTRLAADVWGYVCCRLEMEPDWTGEDACRVAAVVQRVFAAAVRAPLSGGGEFCEFCGAGPECTVCGRGRP